MSRAELQSELHKIIDQVQDEEILLAVRTILNSQIAPFGYSSSGEPLTKGAVDQMLQVSENDIAYNRLVDNKSLKQEVQNWRKK